MNDSVDTGLQSVQSSSDERKAIVINPNYELFMIALLVWQLVNSILWLLVQHPEQLKVIQIVAIGISTLLFLDALRRIIRAPNRRRFLWRFQGWLLLLGSLPIPFISLARLAWYILIIRKLRRSEILAMSKVMVEQRARSTLLAVILAAIVVVELASILIIGAEAGQRAANIHTASDALWWSLVTVATVGYGDKYPITNPGRVVGVLLMIVGVGLFSVMTSFLAKWFLAPQRERKLQAIESKTVEGGDLSAQMDAIRRLIDQQEASQQQTIAELREQLDKIERQLVRSG